MSMARNGFSLNIEFPGLEELIDDLESMPEDLAANLESGMVEYGLLLEEGARELAPYDEGTLMSSIEFQPLKKVANLIEGAVGSELQYAMRRHEDPYKPGTRDKYDNGVKYERYYLNGRGRRTHRKGKWRGMPAGRKYLERAVTATERDWEDIMEEAYDNTLRGRRT